MFSFWCQKFTKIDFLHTPTSNPCVNFQGSNKYALIPWDVNWTNASIVIMMDIPYPKTHSSPCQSSRNQMTQFSSMNYLWQPCHMSNMGIIKLKTTKKKNVRSHHIPFFFISQDVWRCGIWLLETDTRGCPFHLFSRFLF